MNDIDRLQLLCGLEPNVLAEVLENNPRAYMAVKGAVAERHLFDYFERLKNEGSIASFRMAESDFEKDFYVTLIDGSEKIIECKNVEVQKVNTKSEYFAYLKFIQTSKNLLQSETLNDVDDFSLNDLKGLFKSLPQSMRESGTPRYEFSVRQIDDMSIEGQSSARDFLNQFDHAKLSIDFQRTRNSRDVLGSDEDSKASRFYKLDEIDIVGACLFSRTMKWEFVFGSQNSLVVHSEYEQRYSNRLKLNPEMWHFDFLDVI